MMNSQKNSITIWGLFANIILSLVKLAGGLIGNSTALIADALHSAGDILTDIATYLGMYFSQKPPDERHKFGHGKFETFAGFVVGLMVLITGILLAVSGTKATIAFFNGAKLAKPCFFTMIIAFVSILTKEILYRLTIKKARLYNSTALKANAWHHRSDALSSIGVLMGIGGAYILGDKWIVLDPIAAIIVSVFVIIAAVKIIKDAFSELLESSLCDETEEEILSIVSSVDGVVNPHNLRTRRIGPNYAIDLHIEVAACVTVQEGHDIATAVEERLYKKYGEDTSVSIHIEPAGTCEKLMRIRR